VTITDVAVPVEQSVATELLEGEPLPTGRRARRLGEEAERITTGRHARRPIGSGRGTAAWVLAMVAFLALWFALYAIALTPFQQSRQQAVLYNTMREQLSQQTAPLGGAVKPGVPVAVISAPSLGLVDLVVVEGTASGDLMAGPGHRRDTVLPGQAGIAVIYGRAALFGAPFAGLAAAHAGDRLTATTGQGVFTYVVEDRRRAGDHFPQPLAADGSRLTLASAEGSGRFGDLSPTETVYVDLRLTGKTQPSPSGRVVQVPVAERAMQGDPSALLPLALALPLLIGSLVFVVWARARWGLWQTWLVGMPLVLAALWAVSQAAVQLLPNLL